MYCTMLKTLSLIPSLVAVSNLLNFWLVHILPSSLRCRISVTVINVQPPIIHVSRCVLFPDGYVCERQFSIVVVELLALLFLKIISPPAPEDY